MPCSRGFISQMAMAMVVVTGGAAVGCSSPPPPPNDEVDDLAEALRRDARAEVVGGNALELINNGAIFDAMEHDIRDARLSVNIVIYIWRGEDGPSRRIGEALLNRRAGVACRLLVDAFGSLKFSGALEERLTASGCDVRRYRLRGDLRLMARNHRKIQVTDGKTGLTGGWGVWRVWEGDGLSQDAWRDTAVRVSGPAVAQMQRAFEQSWVEAGGPPLPAAEYPKQSRHGPTRATFVASSPRQDRKSEAEIMTELVIGSARRQLWIASSYFVPNESLADLIIRKRRQGVDVRVLAAGPVHDVPPVRAAQRATYERLLEAGVRIFEYQPSMMHSKTMVVDGRTVVIGSTNFDQLSFDRLEEGSIVAFAPFLAGKLRRDFDADFGRSLEITRQLWADRDLLPDLARRASSLFADWL
jgi:cardiolipin synthase A/B